MPISTPTPPYGEIILVYEVSGVRCVNRFFYDGLTAPVAAGDVETFVASWITNCMTLFQDISTTETTVVYVVGRLRETVNLWQAIGGAGSPGGRAGAAPSQQTTANITWQIDGTGGGSRVVRGRTFITCGAEADCTNGLWTDAFVSDVRDFATGLATPCNAGANTMTLKIWRPAYLTLATILGYSVSVQPKVLRHRRV